MGHTALYHSVATRSISYKHLLGWRDVASICFCVRTGKRNYLSHKYNWHNTLIHRSWCCLPRRFTFFMHSNFILRHLNSLLKSLCLFVYKTHTFINKSQNPLLKKKYTTQNKDITNCKPTSTTILTVKPSEHVNATKWPSILRINTSKVRERPTAICNFLQ